MMCWETMKLVLLIGAICTALLLTGGGAQHLSQQGVLTCPFPVQIIKIDDQVG